MTLIKICNITHMRNTFYNITLTLSNPENISLTIQCNKLMRANITIIYLFVYLVMGAFHNIRLNEMTCLREGDLLI